MAGATPPTLPVVLDRTGPLNRHVIVALPWVDVPVRAAAPPPSTSPAFTALQQMLCPTAGLQCLAGHN